MNEFKKPNINFQSFNIDYNIQRIDIRENAEVETKRDEWINWGNINNDYPQFLLQLKQHSPVMSVCIDQKTNMGFGDGVEIEGLGNVLVNKYETISELYFKLLYDYFLFGGWSTETIATRDKSGIESLYHLPFQNIRVGKKDNYDKHDREVDWFYYCENWGDKGKHKHITKFHGLDLTDVKGRQLYYWKQYTPSENKHYPLTPYQSGLDAVVLEAEIFDWHKRNLATSLVPNLFVSLIGDPTPTEKEEIYNELLRSYQGKHGQKLMLAFSNSSEERPVIEPISNAVNDSIYLEVLQMAVQSILSSQGISSPLLIGIHTFSSNPFSQNAEEILIATKHMMEFTIKPAVRKLNQGLESLLALKYGRPIKIINKFRLPEL